MKDICEKLVLEFVADECGTVYRIFELEDIEVYVAKSCKIKNINIITTLKNLDEKNFVSVKYIDSVNVCVCLTEQGKQIIKNQTSDFEKLRKNHKKNGFLLFFVLFFAFFGAFLGTIICNLLFLYVR